MSNWAFSPVNVYFPIWITTLCRVLSRVWFDLSPVKFALIRTTLSVPHPMSFLGAKFFGSSMSFTVSTHQKAVLLHNLGKYFKKGQIKTGAVSHIHPVIILPLEHRLGHSHRHFSKKVSHT